MILFYFQKSTFLTQQWFACHNLPVYHFYWWEMICKAVITLWQSWVSYLILSQISLICLNLNLLLNWTPHIMLNLSMYLNGFINQNNYVLFLETWTYCSMISLFSPFSVTHLLCHLVNVILSWLYCVCNECHTVYRGTM